MTKTDPVSHFEHAKDVAAALEAVMPVIRARDTEASLYHLMVLRASQINQCAFCVDMHTREAREDGESSQRLDRLVVWRHVEDFTPRERAALAWTEALTTLRGDADYAAMRGALRAEFTDSEISTLTMIVAMINLWNRIQVSNH